MIYKNPHVRRRTLSMSSFAWVLLALLAVLTGCDNPTSQQSQATVIIPNVTPTSVATTCATRTSQPVVLNVYYGSEKQAWMQDVVADFNNKHLSLCDGVIVVNAVPIGSGDSMRQIVDGSIQPDVWSPAGSIWLTLLNEQWQKKHGSAIVGTGATSTPPLVNSPVVIAMWRPEAEALGWPQKQIGWADIARLSTDKRGWAAYGHPEFGDFKFGHTHPDYSNSGLDAIIAMNYAAKNKTRGLTVDDVNDGLSKDFVGKVESSIIHYGDSTGFFADKMFHGGPGYLSAAVMYENLVVEANDKAKYPNLPYPVVAVYPKEGTFESDHPYAILQGSWMTPARKSAAELFRDFLLAPAQQQKAVKYGFRPASLQVPITTPVDSTHGVDPNQPSSILQPPPADVVSAVLTSWSEKRRRVDVMLVLDKSGSMDDTIEGTKKIDAAKKGMSEFIGLLSDNDGLGVTVFSNGADVLSGISDLGPKRQNVQNIVSTIEADGSTRLFSTVYEQYKALQAYHTDHIKALIVLTDGQDTANQMTLDELLRQITPASNDRNAGESTKIFTIAYGGDADVDGLTKIASATGGKEYAGTPQNIRAVYQMISTFF